MKNVGYSLVLILGLILQTTVFSQLNLVLLLILLFALIQGPISGSVYGFVGGLLLDLWTGRFLGLQAFTMMVLGLIMGLVADRLYKENLLVRFFAVAGGTFLGEFLYLLGTAAFGFSVSWTLSTWRLISTTGIYNGLLSLLLFRFFVRLNQRLVYLDELFKRTG